MFFYYEIEHNQCKYGVLKLKSLKETFMILPFFHQYEIKESYYVFNITPNIKMNIVFDLFEGDLIINNNKKQWEINRLTLSHN